MHSPNNFQTHKKIPGTLWFGLVLFWDRLELAGSWNAGFLSDNSDSTTLHSVGEGKQKQTGSLLLRWIGLGCHLVWLRFDIPPSKTGLSCQKNSPFRQHCEFDCSICLLSGLELQTVWQRHSSSENFLRPIGENPQSPTSIKTPYL